MDWYISEGTRFSEKRGQLNADRILNLCNEDRWQIDERHYKVMILKSDMYAEDTNFIIGYAVEGMGTIISINRFLSLDQAIQKECIKTETMHELGHVFGLINKNRNQAVKYELGKHCANKCVMRQGLRVPEDWIRITQDRLKNGPFCNLCKEELITYFKN